jgi:hypothetical protein
MQCFGFPQGETSLLVALKTACRSRQQVRQSETSSDVAGCLNVAHAAELLLTSFHRGAAHCRTPVSVVTVLVTCDARRRLNIISGFDRNAAKTSIFERQPECAAFRCAGGLPHYDHSALLASRHVHEPLDDDRNPDLGRPFPPPSRRLRAAHYRETGRPPSEKRSPPPHSTIAGRRDRDCDGARLELRSGTINHRQAGTVPRPDRWRVRRQASRTGSPLYNTDQGAQRASR